MESEQTLSWSVDMHYSDRFEIKVALGLGALFLAPSFIESADAELLRRFLWTPDDDARQTIPVRGTSFLYGEESLRDHLAWEGCHVLVLKPLPHALAMILILYGVQVGATQVTTDTSHWERVIPSDGLVYVVVPGLRRAVGPLDLGAYLAWRLGQMPHAALDNLARDIDAVPQPPPFDL